MLKKGQGLSINTIIIAIIVLVVLVVLVMIFTGYFSGWGSTVASCESKGGTCYSSTPCTSDDFGNDVNVLVATCTTATDVCCPPGSTGA